MSESEPLAVARRMLSVTAGSGVRVTPLTIGRLLSTLTLALPVLLSVPSSAVTVQVTTLLGDAMLGVRVRLLPVPAGVPSMSHSKTMVKLSLSASELVSLQVSAVLVVIPVFGVMVTLLMTGVLF